MSSDATYPVDGPDGGPGPWDYATDAEADIAVGAAVTSAGADVREAEHLPRLPDAADAPRDPFDSYVPAEVAGDEDEQLDLDAAEVSGPDLRLPGDAVEVSRDTDLAADDVPYFRYDPDTDDVTSEPPRGTTLDGGNLVVDA